MITFDAIYGNEVKKAELSKSAGGGEGYALTIDGFHYGIIICQQGKWACYGTGLDELTSDDKDALIERVVAYENGL